MGYLGFIIRVTTANGYIQLFKIDRQYISYSIVSEKLKSEGWLYFQLSGKYANSTHKASFHSFCEKIERIKMKQVNEDFLELNKKKKKKYTWKYTQNDIENNNTSQILDAINKLGLNNNFNSANNGLLNNLSNLQNTAQNAIQNNLSNLQNTAQTAIQNNLSNLQNTAQTAIQENINNYETITDEAKNVNIENKNIDEKNDDKNVKESK